MFSLPRTYPKKLLKSEEENEGEEEGVEMLFQHFSDEIKENTAEEYIQKYF